MEKIREHNWLKKQIAILTEKTGYAADFLRSVWEDLRTDSTETFANDFDYFEKVTLELDW